MRRIIYIFLFFASSLFYGCSKLDLPRDNPMDKGEAKMIKGVRMQFDKFTVYEDSNGDGIVNKGETIGLGICLKNTGYNTAKSVKATFSCTSPYVTNFSPFYEIGYGTIEANTYRFNGGYGSCIRSAITFTILNTTPSGTKIPINVKITDEQGNSWTDSFDVVVYVTNAIVQYGGFTVYEDSNGDHIVNKGETIGLGIKLKNTGSSTTKSVKATFSCTSPYVTNFSPFDEVGYGTIEANTYRFNGGYGSCIRSAITFTVLNTTPSGTKIPINVKITDAQGNTWTDSFEVVVYATNAIVQYDAFTVYEDSNRDHIVNKGETIGLGIKLKNTGSSTAKSVKATFSCISPYVTNFSPFDEVGYGTIEANTYRFNGGYGSCIRSAITFTVLNTTPSGTKIPISVTITDEQGNRWTDSFEVVVY